MSTKDKTVVFLVALIGTLLAVGVGLWLTQVMAPAIQSGIVIGAV